MTDQPDVVAGDDVDVRVTIVLDGAALDLSAATSMLAAIRGVSSDTQYVAATEQSAATPGANWAQGIVAVRMPATATGNLPTGEVLLELQWIVDGLRKTAFKRLTSRRGTIS